MSAINSPLHREEVEIDGRAMSPAPKGWHALRFTEDARKVRIACRQCSRPMWLPPSKVEEYRGCSPECNRGWKAAQRAARAHPCVTCGEVFIPRPWLLRQGYGLSCSQKCNTVAHGAVNSAASRAKAKEGLQRAFAEGRIKRPTGEAHPGWKGGAEEGSRRRRESGQSAACLRRYRAKHPDKVREFSRRRAKRKAGRLPPGTVKRIGNAQGWKCAICCKGIKRTFQVDHVAPLARGGEHAPANLQLLCRPCNTRKGAKDPIAYMRQIGRLL